jgi:hypothetical protein
MKSPYGSKIESLWSAVKKLGTVGHLTENRQRNQDVVEIHVFTKWQFKEVTAHL